MCVGFGILFLPVMSCYDSKLHQSMLCTDKYFFKYKIVQFEKFCVWVWGVTGYFVIKKKQC